MSMSIELPKVLPFSCCNALDGDGNRFPRERIIAFGRTGFVALFEIANRDSVMLLALRHQREEDYR